MSVSTVSALLDRLKFTIRRPQMDGLGPANGTEVAELDGAVPVLMMGEGFRSVQRPLW
jgi:hypothetical protein